VQIRRSRTPEGFAPETIATAILFSMVGYFNGNDKTLWVMVQGLGQTMFIGGNNHRQASRLQNLCRRLIFVSFKPEEKADV